MGIFKAREKNFSVIFFYQPGLIKNGVGRFLIHTTREKVH